MSERPPLERWTLPNGLVTHLGNRVPEVRTVRVMASLPDIPDSELREFDLRKNPHFPIRVKNQGNYGACFPPGTRVRLEDGTERNIEDVRLLDRVVTAEGNIGRVVRTMVRDADSGLINVKLWGHSHLHCTEEHPILTRRGYVAAADLRLDDMVAMPRYAPSRIKSICPNDYFVAPYHMRRASYGPRHINAPEGRKASVIVATPIPDVIHLTPEFGRLCGLFLAEGSTTHGRVVWTFGKHEEETLVAQAAELIRTALGAVPHIQHRNHAINVIVYGAPWVKFFEGLFSTGSGSKRVHADIAGGPTEFLSAMIDGWIAGDGHSRRNETQGVTISKDLALAMYDIAQALGRRPTIRKYDTKTYGAVKTRQSRWEVAWGSSDQDTYRCELNETHAWRKVRGIERVEYDGPVYNLEVEGDNSYVAEGIGVHNCNGHAAATSLEIAQWLSGAGYVPLSPWFVYAILCNGYDRGSIIADALKLLRDKGTCPEPLVPHGTINPNRLSAEARTQAARYRVEIGYEINSHRDLVIATHLRLASNFSVPVNGNFNTLDADGVPGNRAGIHNHAVCGGLGLKKTARHGWVVLTQNSWGQTWGQDGYFWAAEKTVAGSYPDAYCVTAIESDPEEPLPVIA